MCPSIFKRHTTCKVARRYLHFQHDFCVKMKWPFCKTNVLFSLKVLFLVYCGKKVANAQLIFPCFPHSCSPFFLKSANCIQQMGPILQVIVQKEKKKNKRKQRKVGVGFTLAVWLCLKSLKFCKKLICLESPTSKFFSNFFFFFFFFFCIFLNGRVCHVLYWSPFQWDKKCNLTLT